MDNCNFLETMPRKGQFVMVWTHHDRIWSGTFQWSDKGLMRYIPEKDGWEHANSDDYQRVKVMHIMSIDMEGGPVGILH